MSEIRYECGWAVPLKDAGYNKESLEYLKNILGEPKDVDEHDGTIDHFEFEGYDTHCPKGRGGLWIVKNLIERNDNSIDFFESLKEINDTADDLACKFSVNREDIRVFAHDWYTGGDNPFYYKSIV